MTGSMEAAPQATSVIPLARPVPGVLGLGAFLKNTVCLIDGDKALLSGDMGNLDNAQSLLLFEKTVSLLLDSASVKPAAVAHDWHPDFPSTRFAQGMEIEAVAVQHHHAHAAAVMAEHGMNGPCLGLALDGFGLGEDDRSWGGELLMVEARGYRRLGHLLELKQPGGDAAALQPWRMGAAALHALGRGGDIVRHYKDMDGASIIAEMLSKDVICPSTSSCGRLFDAACGLLGVVPVARFEGEAPMKLEEMVSSPRVLDGGWTIEDGVLDTRQLLAALTGLEPRQGADLFHGTLVAALAEWIAWAAEETGLSEVTLSGGCLLNTVLRQGLIEDLERRRLRPITPRRVPPGDSAISLGQAWATALIIEQRT